MLKRVYRLKKNRDFQTVYKRKDSTAAGGVVLYVLRRTEAAPPRAGFSVSKKVGKAVVRNRCRRLLREAVRRHLENIAPGRDYIFVARRSLAEADFRRTERDVLQVLRRKGCLYESDGG